MTRPRAVPSSAKKGGDVCAAVVGAHRRGIGSKDRRSGSLSKSQMVGSPRRTTPLRRDCRNAKPRASEAEQHHGPRAGLGHGGYAPTANAVSALRNHDLDIRRLPNVIYCYCERLGHPTFRCSRRLREYTSLDIECAEPLMCSRNNCARSEYMGGCYNDWSLGLCAAEAPSSACPHSGVRPRANMLA